MSPPKSAVISATFSASTDDVKFYMVDLLWRLKIGSRDMKKPALIAFNEVIHEDARYITVVVLLKIRGELVVRFFVLKNLTRVQEINRLVLEEDAISQFVNLAKSKDETINIRSVDLLQTMARNGKGNYL